MSQGRGSEVQMRGGIARFFPIDVASGGSVLGWNCVLLGGRCSGKEDFLYLCRLERTQKGDFGVGEWKTEFATSKTRSL